MKHMIAAASAALLCTVSSAQADEITDTLTSAIEAYQDGDIQYALEELEFARAALLELKTDSLGAFLPEAPDNWSREVNKDMNQGLAMLGGGVGAEATYSGPGGERVKITLMADNPMVASVGAMVANAAVMGMQVARINRQRVAFQNGQGMALVGNRVLVQTDGDEEAAKMLLGLIDFRSMGNFGL